MTLGRAKSVLSLLWISAFLFLLVVIGMQTFFGNKFGSGDQWDTGFSWFLPLTIPAMSLMISVWGLQQSAQDDRQISSSYVLWAAIAFSAVYLLLMIGLLLLNPFTTTPLETQFRHSAWGLGILQGLVMALLCKLFIANAA